METEATKEKVTERLRRTKQSFDEMRAETQAKARRAVRITNNYAHDHPWRVVTTAVAMAFVVGLLMRKSPRKIVVRKEGDIIIKLKKLVDMEDTLTEEEEKLIEESMEQFKRGETISWEQLKNEMGL